jgi:hypothetical protein
VDLVHAGWTSRHPCHPAATLFRRLGLDPAREMIDLTGRPYKLADGQPIRAIFG